MLDIQYDQLKSVKWFVEQCTRVGIKATQQRREIYKELASTKDHPGAETIYKGVKGRIPAISLDTVYRNLRTLEEHNIINRVGAMGYRARFDANLAPHHHFICTQCGLIRDFYEPRFDDLVPPEALLDLGSVDSHHVEMRGICKNCKKEDKRRD